MFPKAPLFCQPDWASKIEERVPPAILKLLQALGGKQIALAGGAIRAIANDEEIKDFDLFCNSQLAANVALSYFHSALNCKVRTVPGKDASSEDLAADKLILEKPFEEMLRRLQEDPEGWVASLDNASGMLIAAWENPHFLGERDPTEGVFPSEGAPSWGFYREVVEPQGQEGILLGGKPVQICTAVGGIQHGLFVTQSFDLTVCQSLYFWDTDGRWSTRERAADCSYPRTHQLGWECLASPAWQRDTPAKILRVEFDNLEDSLKKHENTLAHGQRLAERGYAWDATHLERLRDKIERLKNRGESTGKLSKGELSKQTLMVFRTKEGTPVVVVPPNAPRLPRYLDGSPAISVSPGEAVHFLRDEKTVLVENNLPLSRLELCRVIETITNFCDKHLGFQGRRAAYLEGSELHIATQSKIPDNLEILGLSAKMHVGYTPTPKGVRIL